MRRDEHRKDLSRRTLLGAAVLLGVATATRAWGGSTPDKAKGRRAMQPGFAKARQAFSDHAATALHARAAQLVVSPVEEAVTVQLDQRVGGAWAFYGTVSGDPRKSTRGWALADGTVITPDRNLGLLLREAGVWTASPTVPAQGLADRLAWALGEGYRVIGSPTLALDDKGAGTLAFVVGFRPAGPGGAGGGPERRTQCTVQLTARRTARLSKKAAAPAAPPLE